jgi:hypothetical protein
MNSRGRSFQKNQVERFIGGWYSTYTEPKDLVGASKSFLDKGYTVVIIRPEGRTRCPRHATPVRLSLKPA